MKNNMSHQSKEVTVQTRRNQGFLPVSAISLVIVALLSACGNAAPEEPVPCRGEAGTYTCEGLSGHEITLTDVPENVFPYLLPVSAQREIELREAAKEDTGCIFMIAGDLAFYDENGELIPEPAFSSPITITYAFLEQDQEEFSKCQNTLVEQGIVADVAEVSFLPVYFDKDVWKPFKEENVKINDNVMTITFTSWGDQPIGGGTQP